MRLSAGPQGGKAISKCPADLVNKDDHENVEGISIEDEDGPFFSHALGKLAYPLSPLEHAASSLPGSSFVLCQLPFCLCFD